MSGKDLIQGRWIYRPDRLMHGGVPFIPWYLRKLREHEQRTGVRLLDVLDVHFYPAEVGMVQGAQSRTDPATAARRIRMTRSLWDPTYTDESWIKRKMQVIPLLQGWIAENYPGLGLSIGEWSFGAEHHMSGALATAEALGRFGQLGVESANYWYYPPDRTPTFWAFKAFRDFDGKGSRFQGVSIPAATGVPDTSIFASRDSGGGRVVAILLNFSPSAKRAVTVRLEGCGAPAGRAYGYAQGDAAIHPVDARVEGSAIAVELPAYSITILDVDPGARRP
jgi:hypothetical protein